MGIPLAALGVRTPQFKSPLDQYGKAVQLKSLLQGQQAGQLQLEQQQQAQKDQQLFRRAYMEAQGDPKKTLELAVRAGVGPRLISQYRDSIVKSRKALEDLDEAGLDNAAKRNDAVGSAFQAVLGLKEEERPQGYAQVRGQLIQGGVIRAQEAPEQYPGDEFMQIGSQSSVSAKDQIAAERQRRVDKETKRHHEAIEGKPTTKERDFQTFYKAYRESKRLPRNAKIEMQARQEFAKLRRTDRTEKPPSASGKALAERTKQRAMRSAEKEYEKKIATLEKDWQKDPYQEGNWFNYKTAESISNADYLALRKDAEDELNAAKEQADESYLAQLDALGFTPGQPVDYSEQVAGSEFKEGDILINAKTGEKVVGRGGKWVPVPK